ncbi:MAG TPA: hypothetical protein VKB34_12825 [Povalibacter sp.]|nr:hypothetical protein [Povalibacter sp.]
MKPCAPQGSCGLVALLSALLLTHASAATTTPDKEGCTDFRFNLAHELALFATAPQPVTAGTSAQNVPTLQQDRLYAVHLNPQAEVKFSVAPGKLTVNEGSYAGVVSFVPAADGLLRVTLDEPAWIDVVANGTAIQSTDHTGSPSCRLLHKSVRFKVSKGVPLNVQISGSTGAEVRLTLSQTG